MKIRPALLLLLLTLIVLVTRPLRSRGATFDTPAARENSEEVPAATS
jgi:hypothetical protein